MRAADTAKPRLACESRPRRIRLTMDQEFWSSEFRRRRTDASSAPRACHRMGLVLERYRTMEG